MLRGGTWIGFLQEKMRWPLGFLLVVSKKLLDYD